VFIQPSGDGLDYFFQFGLFDDSVTGNNDGIINPGETILCLSRSRTSGLRQQALHLSINKPGSFDNRTSSTFFSGFNGARASKNATFKFQVSASAPDMHVFSLRLRITASGGFDRTEQFTDMAQVIAVKYPSLTPQIGWPVFLDDGYNYEPTFIT